MEREFFDWDSWDEGGEVGELQFYNCKLKIDIGPYKSGDLVSCIWVSYQQGIIVTYNQDGTEETHRQKIKLQLV